MPSRHEIGTCPECGGIDLEYYGTEIGDASLYYSVSCNDCTFSGREYYILEFDEYTDDNGFPYERKCQLMAGI